MLLSMTGFGRGVADGPVGRLVVEIQSLNRKYLEIFISLPKEFSRFENEVRKWVSEEVARGQVNVRIHWIPAADAWTKMLPSPEVLKGLKSGWEKLSKQLGFDPKKIDLPFLVQNLPAMQKVDLAEEEDLPILQKSVVSALKALTEMRRKEGSALKKDLFQRTCALEKMALKVEKRSPDASQKMRQKLAEKIGEATPECDERILREVALFAERVDITEEITRLKSHFAQFKALLEEKGPMGRKMEFLVQEMGREINTIGSKSLDIEISRLIVEMKSELEKNREQIQNIE